ncbi:hypothetical protein N7495_002699 [Penicillium taxi]|uniref:uncharacterized protein n=1 Tax=Penicillium taxi TaxID=168475 RepID=UPI002544DD0E|nr:uncharacterized protein N7495_002699 [Penicillium taxi]KAJ5902171.1 hypothetical protein N7495_002699 [Penicillium taxi]
MANPNIQHVMRTDMIRVAFQNPYLMNTILGVGSLHLNRLSPNKERAFAESYFWQNAIQLYQQALSMNLRKDNVDALLSTCMLMGVMTICPEGFKPTDSWVLTNKPEAMNWLCLQSGLRCILKMAAPYIAESIWATAFSEVDKEERHIFSEIQHGRGGLDSDLADLCDIDEFTSEANSIYYAPLRILSPLLELARSGRTTGSNAAHCASFMGRLEFDFLALLRSRDPPALILLAHWMGIMCLLSEDQPWVEGRIRAECIAICMFLEPSTDPQIRRLLYFPATSCGYEKKSYTHRTIEYS